MMQDELTRDDASKNLSANLHRILKDRDWRQSDLARCIQRDDESFTAAAMRVSRYLSRKQFPGVVELHNIARALKVSSDDLIETPKAAILAG